MPTPTSPNIILIVADDLGYGDIGCFGNRWVTTPAIDYLAESGVSLMQHYSASPICAPARAGLLTGRYPHRVGAFDVASNRGLDRIALDETTLADLLRSAGYATGMVGKWHNGLFDRRHHPNRRGFDEFAGFLNGGMDYFDWILDINGQPQRSDGRYLTDIFSGLASAFIKRHAEEPFFLYIAYNAPHSPLQAPLSEIEAYRDVGRFNEAVCRLYAMIHRMDIGIERVLETLRACGIDENTLVLFTSDNGPWLGEQRVPDGRPFPMTRFNGPLRGMKQDVLEGGIRVPAIVRWPARLPAGAQTDDLVHFCDWLPTLAAVAGVTAHPAHPPDGDNVLAALDGDPLDRERPWFWQYSRYAPVPGCNAAVRDGPWKLVWHKIPAAMEKLPIDNVWYRGMFSVPHFETPIDRTPVERTLPGPQRPHLYHLVDDPAESRDLARQYPDRVRQMTLMFADWFDDIEVSRRR